MDEPAFQTALKQLLGSDGFNTSEFLQPGKKVEATLEQAALISFTVSTVHHLTFLHMYARILWQVLDLCTFALNSKLCSRNWFLFRHG